MELDNATLFNTFISVTEKHRRAFIQSLEDKYVKTEKESDIIDLKSLRIIQNRGHIKKIKKSLKYGSMNYYPCEKGQKILTILKRKIRNKRKTRLTIYGNGEKSSNSAAKTHNCSVKLVRLSKKIISSWSNVMNFPDDESITLHKKNQIINETPKLTKTSVHFQVNEICNKRCVVNLFKLNLNATSYSAAEIEKLNVDVNVKNFLNNGINCFNRNNEVINETPIKTSSCNAAEIENIYDINNRFKSLALKKKIPLSHLPLNVKEKPLISPQTYICNEIKSLNLRSSQNDSGKKVLNVDNRKENHCSSLTVTSEKFKNDEIKNKSKFMSFYKPFHNRNLSEFNLQNCPELSSKTGGKFPSYEINSLYSKPFEPYKRRSHSLQNCRISPLPCPVVSEFPPNCRIFPLKISAQTNIINLK